MGTGTAVAALAQITAAKMNLKLETVDTANITTGNVTAACLGAESVIAGKLQTTTLDATNALLVVTGALAGGIGVTTGQLRVVLEASNPSLKIASNELGVKIYANGGLAKDANGVSVLLPASSGLTAGATGLLIDLNDTTPGLALAASGLGVLLDADKGIVSGAGGLSCKVKANSGIVANSDGFATVIETSKGISVGASGLAVDFDNTTLGIVSTKLAVKAAGVSNSHLSNPNHFNTYTFSQAAVPISLTASILASFKMPAAFTVTGVTVWCTATAATATIDIQEATTTILTGAITPIAGTLVDGVIADAAIASGAELRVLTTTNGSGTITNCTVCITGKFAHAG
jgi:hypothetical protein